MKLETLSAITDTYTIRIKEAVKTAKMGKLNEMQVDLLSELGITIYHANKKLNLDLTLSQFVPCKDGKPMNEPHVIDTYYSTSEYREMYQQAEKAVIFEGFEVTSKNAINNGKWFIVIFQSGRFLLDEKVGVDEYLSHLMPENPTVSDLAEATQDNPITLK